MGKIKERIYDLAELAYQIMDAGATDQEVDEYVESQISPEEYEFYHAHKDIIMDMLPYMDKGFDEDDDLTADDYDMGDEDPNPSGLTPRDYGMDESYIMESLFEGCNCGGGRRPTLQLNGKRPLIVRRPPVKKTTK